MGVAIPASVISRYVRAHDRRDRVANERESVARHQTRRHAARIACHPSLPRSPPHMRQI